MIWLAIAALLLPGLAAADMEMVAQLTRESDYTRFVAADVDPGVRNAAMKKLFSDPHFNVMDGLDIYIDDYTISDPIPEAMLATLTQARGLLFDAPEEAAGTAEASADCDILAGAGQNVPVAPPGVNGSACPGRCPH